MAEKKCPFCKSDILKRHGEEIKMRAKIVIWTKNGITAVCKNCGKDVPISKSELKSVEEYISQQK